MGFVKYTEALERYLMHRENWARLSRTEDNDFYMRRRDEYTRLLAESLRELSEIARELDRKLKLAYGISKRHTPLNRVDPSASPPEDPGVLSAQMTADPQTRGAPGKLRDSPPGSHPFHENWRDYSVLIGDHRVPLKNLYAQSLGFDSFMGTLALDTGSYPGIVHLFRVRGDDLYAVDPDKPFEDTLVGKLEREESPLAGGQNKT